VTASEVEPSSWWGRLGRGQRAVVAVVAVVVAVNAVLASLGGLVGGTPGGPVSSSFSTGGGGFRGWSELLERQAHPVQRLRDGLGVARLRPTDTVVVADPESLDSADVQALVRFVRSGGRLVLAGPLAGLVLEMITNEPLGTTTPISSRHPVHGWVPAPELAGVSEVVGARHAWAQTAGGLPIAGTSDGQPVVLVASVGQGRIVAVSDASVFDNQHLDQADNAAFALRVAGDKGRRVVFAESLHGFAASGTDAIPSTWKWGLLLLLVALLVGFWSAGSRFGPPEPSVRALRPARRQHVDAVAADLDLVAMAPADTVDPLLRAARADLAARLGVAADASPSVLHARATEAGIDPAVVTALTHPVDDAGAAQFVGAVAAVRQQVHHGRTPTDTVPTDPASGGTHP
jgi:hypothetical protein